MSWLDIKLCNIGYGRQRDALGHLLKAGNLNCRQNYGIEKLQRTIQPMVIQETIKSSG